jgi:hypothetical protein
MSDSTDRTTALNGKVNFFHFSANAEEDAYYGKWRRKSVEEKIMEKM